MEAVEDPGAVLRQIRGAGAGVGLAINPSTPISAIEPHIGACDLVLVMAVEPGFGGQAFSPVALEKLRALRGAGGQATVLEVDGGVDEETAGPCVAAGAELLVAGSAIFRSGDYARAVAATFRVGKSVRNQMPQILLIRPGSTEYDRQGRIQGTLDIPLNEEGRQEVLEVVQQLKGQSIEAAVRDALAGGPGDRAGHRQRTPSEGEEAWQDAQSRPGAVAGHAG